LKDAVAPLVIVAHEAEAIREAALRIVREAGYRTAAVEDGHGALALLEGGEIPAALIVDVALPGRLGYELCEDIRQRGLSTRVILVASVYSRTAYKRKPTSLYGADDYVEQHHIPDKLGPKLARLVPAPRPQPERDIHDATNLTSVERAEIKTIRTAGEDRLEPAHEDLQSIARVIVADVLLYSGRAVEEGIRAGDLAERLGHDLVVARDLFERQAGRPSSPHDYIGEALAEFVATRKQR
jgi:CheY-like chemotaxis protein